MGLLLTLVGGNRIENKSCLPTKPCLYPRSALTEVRAWETQHLTIIKQGFWLVMLFVKKYYFNILPVAAAVKWIILYNINHLLSIIRIKYVPFWSPHFTFPTGITIKWSINSHLMVMGSFSDIAMWFFTNVHSTLLSWIKIICQDSSTLLTTIPWVLRKINFWPFN